MNWTNITWTKLMVFFSLHKKWSFPLRISLVNVTKSSGNSGFGHINLKKSLMENLIFCAVFLIMNNKKYGIACKNQGAFLHFGGD